MKAIIVVLSFAILAATAYAVYLGINDHIMNGVLVILALLAFIVTGLAIGKYDYKRSIRDQGNPSTNQKG